MAVLLATVAAAIALLPALQLLVIAAGASVASTLLTDMPRIAEPLQIGVSVAPVMFRTLVQPVLPYIFVLVVAMSAMCAVVAIALNRIVFRRPIYS